MADFTASRTFPPARPVEASGATPAMARWFEVKAEHPDALLFFRMGDFYELFFEDAQAAATALDIALTSRGSHQGEPIPMCGVPASQRDVYLARLVKRGFRVAVAEQMEAPSEAKARGGKAPIRREVTRIITPGTVTEEALLEAGQANYLLALARIGGTLGAAWLDVSTGSFDTAPLHAEALPALLGRLNPAEILAPEDLPLGAYAPRRAPADPGPAPAAARRMLGEAFGAASLDAFGAFSDTEAVAAASALRYVERSQAGSLPRLSHPVRQAEAGLLSLDAATRASLDLLRGRDGGEQGSLLGAVKRTVTAAGTRLLAEWIANPLDALEPLTRRQVRWRALHARPKLARDLRAALRGAPDLARGLARLSLAGRNGAGQTSRLSPRDLGLVRDALEVAAAACALLSPAPPSFEDMAARLDPAPDLAALLKAALAETPPLRTGEAVSIRSGFDGELDGERRLRDEARQVIASLQRDLAGRYGVASLKVRHHNQLGYVLEAPSSAVESLRRFPELILRQGLAAQARYTHPELAELDRRIAEAHERAAARESLILDHLLRKLLEREEALAGCASALATLDVLQSAASLAESGRWCAPVLTEDQDFAVVAGRHPVVEAALPPGRKFIPNDTDLGPARRLMLLTGPNMAGKSTFLRQNALITVLAQAGLPVPAESARIGLVDRLFSRVGAADDLAAGRSTFMVEMTETASILHQAGPRSFVIVDEIGRGTGTRDGLAIAQAVLEAMHGTLRCRAIFATHFHDLVSLTEALPRLRPCTMRVKEWRGEVVFLHEVMEGAAERSWGVHVAKLAGVPAPVVRRAEFLLRLAERDCGGAADLPLFESLEVKSPQDDVEPDVKEPEDCVSLHDLLAAVAALDPERMTPLEALQAVFDLRAKLPTAPPNRETSEEVPGLEDKSRVKE
ncbi:MAG TPA: DNA mismatch repair protein MutS [Acetobacteraceae bacterium]|nr:DNA mismatch repair protein MutS [Acetobacteraceae bacterium]